MPGNHNSPVPTFEIYFSVIWEILFLITSKMMTRVLGPASQGSPGSVRLRLDCRGEIRCRRGSFVRQMGSVGGYCSRYWTGRILKPCSGSARSCAIMQWQCLSLANKKSVCVGTQYFWQEREILFSYYFFTILSYIFLLCVFALPLSF